MPTAKKPAGAVLFFATPARFRRWLEAHHRSAVEQWVGFHKRASGKPSLTWPESVDEALCFGWIDGVRKSIDAESYKIRFSPRRPSSIWSTVNIRRAEELIAAGRMAEAGQEAFARRREDRSGRYAYEQQGAKLTGDYERRIKANRKAWKFFSEQPPWYRRTTGWWVMSAKKEETRDKRLRQLIADSESGRWIDGLRREPKKP
jgi:uncharacterized protein YdeI (YjbR/CyaY-like superfamily)